MNNIIILFTRYPEPGKCKTRLIPSLGPEGACNLQKSMISSIISTIKSFCKKKHCDFVIHYDDNISQNTKRLMKNVFHKDTHLQPQSDGNLGEKMRKSIAFHQNDHASIVLVGSDCPDIDVDIFEESFQQLRDKQVVLGPTYDGGYYLIGIQAGLSQEELAYIFYNIPWSSDKVLQTTTNRLKRKKLRYALVKKLHDIDTPDDLRHLNNYPNPQ